MCDLTPEQIEVLKTDDRAKSPAPEGFRWVCLMCGKSALDRSGPSEAPSPEGWDISCYLNAVMAHESTITYNTNGIVTNISQIAYNPNFSTTRENPQ
jgi:hypothetical protein